MNVQRRTRGVTGKVWFTADTHYFHGAILRLAGRPFRSLDHMHEEMIARWNAVVGPKDTVFHLGDLSHDLKRAEPLLRDLNGRGFLIAGNHDRDRGLKLADALGWDIEQLLDIKVQDPEGRGRSPGWQYITLCHYPMVTWNYRRYGSWMLHGHSHGTRNHQNAHVYRLDVGVDCWGFAPISYDQVRAAMAAKTHVHLPRPDRDAQEDDAA